MTKVLPRQGQLLPTQKKTGIRRSSRFAGSGRASRRLCQAIVRQLGLKTGMLPFDGHGPPGQAAAEADEDQLVARREPARRRGFAQGDGD